MLLQDSKIYDIPCDISRPETPEAAPSLPSPKLSPKEERKSKTDFEKLLQNFEKGPISNPTDIKRNSNYALDKKDTKNINGIDINNDTNDVSINKTDEEKFGIKVRNSNAFDKAKFNSIKDQISNFEETKRFSTEKPPMKPKPFFNKSRVSKSSENLIDEIKSDAKTVDGISSKVHDGKSDMRKQRKFERRESGVQFTVPKKNNSQLDVDKENVSTYIITYF